ncbi:MAG: formyltransferase family protein [Polaribacter sp.]
MKLGILTSGNLGLDTLEKIIPHNEIGFVLTDTKSDGIINLCRERGIPCFKGNPRNGKGFEFIKYISVDVIASINYLFLIESDIIHHSTQFTFNIHGSLLPKYRGRTPHVWAIINNEKVTGITAHLIDEGCDTGDVISQIAVQIEESDTGNDLLNKYKLEYYNLVKDVLDKAMSGKLVLTRQNNNFATYFGKRTPDDGEIDWNWQKERIRNWVRAQADPYPGAFTYLKGTKVIIDRVVAVEEGFNFEMENGTVLKTFPEIIVKTSNGALAIKSLRETINVQVGDKFTRL